MLAEELFLLLIQDFSAVGYLSGVMFRAYGE